MKIYQYDNKPLANRAPFLLVHGLRGEYYPDFRWEKVAKKFADNREFDRRFKIYMLRYDSLALLNTIIPAFRSTLSSFYQSMQQRPITVMALSLGGNLVYQSMLEDKETDNQINVVFTLGTPFHGSPLFCKDWVNYSIYKNMAWPWTRMDHALAYKFYFAKNSSLLSDLRWDNWDDSIPQIGGFKSKLAFGPKGDLTVQDTINTPLLDANRQPFPKKKLITYSGYLLNPYMLSNKRRFAETTVMVPYTLMFMKVPAHLAREHPVLKLLNCQISSIITDRTRAERCHTPFVYQLNDGITPVSSALFLPFNLADKGVAKQDDIAKLRGATDVRLARIFKDIDHLTFIDGYRPLRAPALVRDELNPDEAARNIFEWMLNDVLATAKEPPPNTIAKDTVPAPDSITDRAQ